MDLDNYNKLDSNQKENSVTFPILVFGAQSLFQVFQFVILFLLMTGTYLFRVGLIGVLARNFRAAALITPVYMLLTVAVGITRMASGRAACALRLGHCAVRARCRLLFLTSHTHHSPRRLRSIASTPSPPSLTTRPTTLSPSFR